MEQPLVSVIVPTYNRQELLKETLLSILAQTYRNIEVIVVDNCSNYDFFESIHSLNDPRIRPFQNANGGIIAVNRNFGLRQAKGKYLAFCDDDDLWLPEKLEKQIRILEEKPEILLVGTNIMTFPQGRKNNLVLFRDKVISFDFLLKAPLSFSQQTKIANSSVVFRAEIIQKIGFLDENKAIAATEDYDYWLKILHFQDNSVYILQEDLVHYRIHAQNATVFSPEKPTVFDRLRIIYQKYPNTELLINCLDHEKQVFIIKNLFYENSIGISQLFQKPIPMSRKLEILFKKVFISLMGK